MFNFDDDNFDDSNFDMLCSNELLQNFEVDENLLNDLDFKFTKEAKNG